MGDWRGQRVSRWCACWCLATPSRITGQPPVAQNPQNGFEVGTLAAAASSELRGEQVAQHEDSRDQDD
jgi:hypothetical protein